MESKISQSQKEVWEWKEALFEEIKNIPKLKRLQYIKEKTRNTILQIEQAHQKNLLPS